MAFKHVNRTLIDNSNHASFDNLAIDGTDVLVTDGLGNITLQNVSLDTNIVSNYTDTDAINAVTGSDLNMGTNNITTTGKILFKNKYDNVSDLPSASTYHGMFAHVHATGKGYFAHAGNWVPLANESDLPTTTTDIAEGSNLYYTDARVDLRINAATTDNISEGTTNLYYTDERVDDRVDNLLVGGTNITLTYDDTSNTLRIDAAAAGGYDLSGNNTGDLTEGSNLYYTDARADARITNALSGNITIGGDLTVNGTTTTINTNELNIGDNTLTLNSDETGVPSQNAGIEVERGTSTNVSLRWNETSDQWQFSNDGTTYIALGTASTFTGTTDGVTEGTTNLYYTDAKSRNAISVSGDLGYNSATGVISFTETPQDFAYSSLTGTPTIPTNNNQLTNGAGYITGYTVTQSDVDARLSGGTGVTYSSGTISIGQSVGTSNNVQFNSLGVGTAGSGTTGEIRATNDLVAFYSSDSRLKENIININNAVEKVKKINGVTFDWTQDFIDSRGGEDDYFVRKRDIGVIAQEVEEVIPEVVGTRQDGYKAVKYDRIVALLIEAIKDQQKQIDDLKNQIKHLDKK